MRRGELHVFMTIDDENTFIKQWSAKGVQVVNCWQPVEKQPMPLSKSLKRPDEVDGIKIKPFKRPWSLNLLRMAKKPKISFHKNVQQRYHQIDWQSSDVVEYYRGMVSKTTLGMGHFLMGTYEQSERKPQYLVELWNDLKKWLRHEYFSLPRSGGYLGPGALKLALKIGEVASTHVYKIEVDRTGKHRAVIMQE